MPKLTNVRERVHQPFFDTLIRSSGFGGTITRVQPTTDLFTVAGKPPAETNVSTGAVLPSDQSHVTLALRCFLMFRNPQIRAAGTTPASNGDIGGQTNIFGGANAFGTGAGAGNAPGDVHDVHRLYHQAAEQLHWSFGTGEKDSIRNMPAKYFPDGSGLFGDVGGNTDLIYFVNGEPSHQSILRIARAVLITPRQNIKCQANIFALPDGGNAAIFGSVRPVNGLNMLSLVDNLNAVDAIMKIIQFCFDGLFARDVQ